MQYKYTERQLNHIVIYCCYSILKSLTYSLNCVLHFLRVYCINRIPLHYNVVNTINKVTFLNYWSIPPISDSTNSRQKIRNWLPNFDSDSLAEKWQSHLAPSGRLLLVYFTAVPRGDGSKIAIYSQFISACFKQRGSNHDLFLSAAAYSVTLLLSPWYVYLWTISQQLLFLWQTG